MRDVRRKNQREKILCIMPDASGSAREERYQSFWNNGTSPKGKIHPHNALTPEE
jgi:hypothetical protein